MSSPTSRLGWLLTLFSGMVVQTAIGAWYASRIVVAVEQATDDNRAQDLRITALEAGQANINGTLARIDERTKNVAEGIKDIKQELQGRR